MAAAASNAVEERLLDDLSAEQRMMLLCCCCGQTVRDPVLLRCLHGCCSSCATQLRKEENERQMTGDGTASAPVVPAARATPMLAPQSSLAGQSALTSADPGYREVKPALPAALCRSCGEPLLLASGGAERRNYFLASMLHSQLVKEQCRPGQLVPPPPAPPPCDSCKKGGDGSVPAAASRHRCDQCRLNLCDRCVRWHNVFRAAHQPSLSPLPPPSPWQSALTPTPACSTHGGRLCNAACLTCTRATCDHCARACRDRKHDVRDVAGDDRRRVIDDDVVKAAEARRKDVLSNRTSLCDQLSLLVEHQKEASRRREAGARVAREVLAARRRSLLAAVDRARDTLDECCRWPRAPSLQQRSAGRGDAGAAMPPPCRETAALDRNVRHLLAYSEAFASRADDLILLEQHEIVTARLTMLKKDLEAATAAANRACEEGSEEERRLRELAHSAPPAGEDELLEAVARLCLLGRVQQLPEVLRNSPGSIIGGNSGDGSSGGGSCCSSGVSSGGCSGENSGTSRGGSSGKTSGGPVVDRRATMNGDSALVAQPGSQSQLSVLRPELHRFNGEVARRTPPPAERASAAASDRPISAEATDLASRKAPSAGPSLKLSASPASRSAAAGITTADTDLAAARPHRFPSNPMQLGYPRSRFRTKTPCLGLTFTADGHLLLAAGEEGLLEFAPEGPLVGGWRPPQPGGYVAGAAALGDGRVAVILRDSQSLSLLRRKRRETAVGSSSNDSWMRGHGGDSHDRNRARGTRWTLDRQVPLQLVSRSVAACGVLMAAAGGPSGRRLRIVSLVNDDCTLLMDRELDCAVLGLALTQRLLVIVCEPPAQQAAGGGFHAGSRDRPCAVHCHAHNSSEGDYSGGSQLLWSTVCNHWASDVCASPCGQIVYLTLPYADRVLAMDAADGSSLATIRAAADGWALSKPSWLAVWQGVRSGTGAAGNATSSGGDVASTTTSHGEGVTATASAVAAMLSTDLHSVSVFPVIL